MKVARCFAIVLLGAIAGGAQAQPVAAYPDRPVRLIVPFVTGGTLDTTARIVAERLAEALGQPFVVENRVGAGGNIGTGFVAKSVPDGHTLLHTITGTISVNPALYRNLAFDPVRELAPVVGVTSQGQVLVVDPALPPKTLKEFIEYVRARPGQFFFGSAGAGAFDHLAAELFNSMAGIRMTHVPYKGSAAVQNDLMAGRLAMAVIGMSAVPLINSGKVRALAVTSARRARVLPELPTIGESGFPQYEMVNSNAIFAPAGTPRAIVLRLNDEVNRILKLPDIRKRLESFGVDPVGGTPEELAVKLKTETATLRKVLQDAGVKPVE